MESVQAEVLVNGDGLQRVFMLGEGWLVLSEEEAAKMAKVDTAKVVARKVIAMLKS